MSTVITIKNGKAEAVYDDRFMPLFKALGFPLIKRATEVEYDEVAGEWVATHIATGKIIARGTNRSRVIEREVAWLEGRG